MEGSGCRTEDKHMYLYIHSLDWVYVPIKCIYYYPFVNGAITDEKKNFVAMNIICRFYTLSNIYMSKTKYIFLPT